MVRISDSTSDSRRVHAERLDFVFRYISNVAVSPDHRRQGIASTLIEALLRRAEELQLSFVTLEVRESNAPAIALYGRFGFTPVGRRKGYYDAPKEDAILMTRLLK